MSDDLSPSQERSVRLALTAAKMRTKLVAIRSLHRAYADASICAACGEIYPCRTVEILDRDVVYDQIEQEGDAQ